jgi:uncharacterized protein (TIGR00303 family)
MLPSNPLGAPGPAGITRAALQHAGLTAGFLGVGLRIWPTSPCLRVADEPGSSITLGCAVPRARELFDTGLTLGAETGRGAPCVVLGESVPGGTTTALAVLLGLGYAADGRVSGSIPGNAHRLKSHVAHLALEVAGLSRSTAARVDPLQVVRHVGDPMQPLAAGIALGAARVGSDVLLAGGSQMLAVVALMRALAGTSALERIAIGTTRWVVEDPAADVSGLASEIWPRLPLLAINLDFSRSRHLGLRQYEDFLVKEGVGAGGACIAALLRTGASIDDLHDAIDTTYDALLGRLPRE